MIEWLIPTITSVSAVIGTMLYVNRMMDSEHLLEKVEDIVTGLLNDQENQKKLFALGGLIGQGIKTGVGINPATSGKFKLQDLITQIIGRYLTLGQQQHEPQISQAPSGMG